MEYKNILKKFRQIKSRVLDKKLKKYYKKDNKYLSYKGRELLKTL